MNKPVSSVTENQFVFSTDLMLYMKLVPKIRNTVELWTNARQYSIAWHRTSFICRLNQDDHHILFINKLFYIRPTQNCLFKRTATYFGRNSQPLIYCDRNM